MWLYWTSGDAEHPVVLYEHQPNRSSYNPKSFLNGFTGYLHTDGYSGYHNLPENITVVGCWAHARRKFDEAVKALPKNKSKESSAAQGLAYCTRLFEIEKTLADLSPNDRYAQRLEQEKTILDALRLFQNLCKPTKEFCAVTSFCQRDALYVYFLFAKFIVPYRANGIDVIEYLTNIFRTGERRLPLKSE